ncbi:SDR family NAD(P)-dependent oxidoreductase [Sphingomonas kyeonggiensis]|uniref:NAD(P)-dependent dehydrogenase (Short-subunit alcohol dehydrogenase family) n=1 Tax=Sphingomonas kyeonggiensis TaxID=1268553 RepID=A0A7W6JUB8_9SPHN|nr:glucose 1-dehydrogenase [Sphingomonas kyeonggiensis]MBB4098657.1 NAD(P)-dependent dehydrogenase (short-subunit alcohol dehydrogenase family) [Sphingomonas kyeonggiensis]
MALLSGKTAMITGGTSGIGFAIARSFAAEGAQVIVTGRRADVAEEAARRIGNGAASMVGDVADPEFHAWAADEVGERFGGLDIYVANAGINTIRHSAEVPQDEYDAQFATNTRGVFVGVQKMAPLIRDHGAIVITGSLASEKVLDGHTVYAGSKAAINAFARSWALELRGRGIRVNVLSPGPTDTEILGKLGVSAEQRPAFEAQMAAAIPLGRLGRPEELASAALFLASDMSSFVTGVNLRVDGGMALL